MEPNEPVGVMVLRVVMRPVNDRSFPCVVNVFAAHVDRIARLHGYTRCEVDVVDYLHRTCARTHAEGFMFALRFGSVEKSGPRSNDTGKIDFGRTPGGDCACKIHTFESRRNRRVARTHTEIRG